MMENRRRFPRANYPCQLTIWRSEGSAADTILANTANIGLGGLAVYLNQEIAVGAKVDIQIKFTSASTPFKCHGHVVRCQVSEKNFYDVGVQFESLSEIKHAFLEGKVSELIALEKKDGTQ